MPSQASWATIPASGLAANAAARSAENDMPLALTIRDLIIYRLQKAIVFTAKPSHAAYSERFGVTGVEWRLIGNLALEGPLSLQQLAREVDIQLAQASRAVTGLIGRGLVRGDDDARDGRRVLLSLTREGRALFRKVFAHARKIDARLLAILSEREQEALFEMLERLAEHGRSMMGGDLARP
jgi:DNA-binding MarR family transcriptional regulator